jgi:hypothetical protein
LCVDFQNGWERNRLGLAQRNYKACTSFAGFVAYAAAMGFSGLAHDCQTETGAANLPLRDKRLEKRGANRRRDTRAVISDFELYK